MSKRSGLFRRKTKGTILFTVVTVMFMLMLLILATLTVSTAAKTKAYDKFAENQAYYTARSLLDLGDKLANYDYDFNKDVIGLSKGGSPMVVNVKLGAAQGKYYGEKTKITVTCLEDGGTPVVYQTNPTNTVSYVPCTIRMTASCEFLGRKEEVSKIYTTVKFTSVNNGSSSPNPGNSNNAITAFNGGASNHQFKSYGGTSYTGSSMDTFTVKGNTSFIESSFFESNVEITQGSAQQNEGLFFFPGNNFVVDKNLTIGNDTYPIHVSGKGGHMYVNGKITFEGSNQIVLGGDTKNPDPNNSYTVIANEGIDFGSRNVTVNGPTYIGNSDTAGSLVQNINIANVEFKDNAYISATSLNLTTDQNGKDIDSIIRALDNHGYGKVYTTGAIYINGESYSTLYAKANDAQKAQLDIVIPKPLSTSSVVGSIDPKTLKQAITVPTGDGNTTSVINVDTKYSINMSYYKRDASGNILNTNGKPFVNGTGFDGDPAILTALEMANISDPDYVTNLQNQNVNTTSNGQNKVLTSETGYLKPTDLAQNGVLHLNKPDGKYNLVLKGDYMGTIYVEQGASVNFFIPEGEKVNLNKLNVVYGDMADAAGYSPTNANPSSGKPIIIDNRENGKSPDAVSAPKIYLFSDTDKDIQLTNGSYFQGYIYAPKAKVSIMASAPGRQYSFTGKNFTDSDTMTFSSDSNVVGSLVCGSIETQNTNGAIFVYNGTGYGGGSGGGSGGGGSDPVDPTPLTPEQQAQLIIDSNGTLWRSFYIE